MLRHQRTNALLQTHKAYVSTIVHLSRISPILCCTMKQMFCFLFQEQMRHLEENRALLIPPLFSLWGSEKGGLNKQIHVEKSSSICHLESHTDPVSFFSLGRQVTGNCVYLTFVQPCFFLTPLLNVDIKRLLELHLPGKRGTSQRTDSFTEALKWQIWKIYIILFFHFPPTQTIFTFTLTFVAEYDGRKGSRKEWCP